VSLILASGICLVVDLPALADQPLPSPGEGTGVLPSTDVPPEPMPVPVVAPRINKPLQGSVDQAGLQGGTQNTGLTGGTDGTGWTGDAQRGRIDQSRPGQLQGSASQTPMALNIMNDPDAGNQELQIEWDRWRNTLMQTIQLGTLAKINVHNDVHFIWDARAQMMVSRYPNGVATWYSCDVLPNRTIINIRLVQSSRYPSFDQAVFEAINELQGNNILVYPSGSRRQIVSQESSVRTAAVTQLQNFQFGDVERQRH